MVAFDHQLFPVVFGNDLPDRVHTFLGIRAVAHNIPQTHQSIVPDALGVIQNGLKGLQIAMDVGKDGDSHNRKSSPGVNAFG